MIISGSQNVIKFAYLISKERVLKHFIKAL